MNQLHLFSHPATVPAGRIEAGETLQDMERHQGAARDQGARQDTRQSQCRPRQETTRHQERLKPYYEKVRAGDLKPTEM